MRWCIEPPPTGKNGSDYRRGAKKGSELCPSQFLRVLCVLMMLTAGSCFCGCMKPGGDIFNK